MNFELIPSSMRGLQFLGALILMLIISHAARADINLRLHTDLGGADIVLFDVDAPITVTNFLNYVNRGDYDGTFIHRSARNPAVIQGGGFTYNPDLDLFIDGADEVPKDPPIMNEPGLSNLRGTLAMAKIDQLFDGNGDPVPGTGPDSATSQWFVNLDDNLALDTQNGGFTVFGEVLTDDDMEVFDDIAGLLRCIDVAIAAFFCGDFPEVPAADTDVEISNDNLVNVIHIGADDDGDGAIDELEDGAPNGGDVNGDMILDSTQQHVASFPNESGDYSSIETQSLRPISGLDILGATFLLANPAAGNLLAETSFNHGIAGFDINNVGTGSAEVAILRLPAGLTATTFFNFGPTLDNPTPHWYEFLFDGETGAEFSGNVVTLHYVDGKRGDSDIEANGIIKAARGGLGQLVGDGDGIASEIEDGAPNGGDGDNDGTLDSLQPNVASFQDFQGADYLTIKSPEGSVLGSMQSVSGQGLFDLLQGSGVSGLNFSHGIVFFNINNIDQAGQVEVVMYLPETESPVSYYKFGPTPDNPVDHWYEFNFDGETGAEISGNVITLHFVDGERGDADLEANGVILDPGAPALVAGNTNTGGGGGGGCSLATSGRTLSSGGEWWLLLSLIAVLGVWVRCRRFSN